MSQTHRSSNVPDEQKQIVDLLQTVIDEKGTLSVSEATVKYGKGCSKSYITCTIYM